MSKVNTVLVFASGYFQEMREQYGPDTGAACLELIAQLRAATTAREFCDIAEQGFDNEVDSANEVLEFVFNSLDIKSLDEIKQFF